MVLKQLLRPNLNDDYGLLKLQNVILNIMYYIDELCKKNDIEYYVIGGTALGAIRHGGFIPWDDDLDIAMTRNNYEKFCKICRANLDEKDFYFQEGLIDWSSYHSKIRLKGTYIHEVENEGDISNENKGIFIDIFPLDNPPNSSFGQRVWYFCGKILVAHSLLRRGYKSAGFLKKLLMYSTFPLYIKPLRNGLYKYVLSFNKKPTKYIGGFSLVSRFKNTISPASIWGKSKYIPFETIQLQAPSNPDAFLRFYFGDYMKLPPEEARKMKHATEINYGSY